MFVPEDLEIFVSLKLYPAMMFKPSIGLAVMSISIPFPFVAPTNSFKLLFTFRVTPSPSNWAVWAKLLLEIWYKVTFVLKIPLQKSFLIPTSYWSMIEGANGLKSTVVPVLGVNEFE